MMYNFKKLVKAYSSDSLYRLQEGQGNYDEFGQYKPGQQERTPLIGAVTNLKTDELVVDEGGAYNADDRKLYCYEEMDKGSKIIHKDKRYTIMEDMDYSEHDKGLHIYYMKSGDVDA